MEPTDQPQPVPEKTPDPSAHTPKLAQQPAGEPPAWPIQADPLGGPVDPEPPQPSTPTPDSAEDLSYIDPSG